MTCWRRLLTWWRRRRNKPEPWDSDFPAFTDTDPPRPDGMFCPNTQPASEPGVLDTLLGKLK
jgi:hypothetical protein